MARTALIVLALALPACTGGSGTPPPPSPVARPAPGPQPYRKPAATPVARAPQPGPSGGALSWLTALAQAQSEARSEGKLILVGSTKPGCSMCDKFQHEIAPACAGRLRQVAVCYIYDITRPEDARVDRTLRANLPGEFMMPLVGFVTPDLRWVHGFGGSRSVAQFMSDIETAARSQPARVAAAAPAAVGPAVAFVNEYGETEWSAPADVWPTPVDALGPVPTLAAAPAAPAPEAGSTAAQLDAIAAALPSPSISIEPVVIAADAPSVAAGPPPAPLASGAAMGSSSDEPLASRPAVAAAPPAPSPAPLPAGPMSEAEARQSIERAHSLIRGGRFDEARDELKRVSRSLPNTAIAREADKGGVAVYNARRIAQANGSERDALAARARRDLGGSLWETLF